MRLESVRAVWPERMSLSVRYEGRSFDIRTRLLGEYATFPVLAAVAIGVVAGMDPEAAAKVVGDLDPVDGRMSPRETPGGITFIDNGWKTPYYIVPAILDFLQTAEARRKIVVFGAISDYPGSSSPRYRRIARAALEVADIVVFSGRWAEAVAKVQVPEGKRLVMFQHTAATREGLKRILQEGDLVVLTGSQSVDHFERIVLDRVEQVDCWSHECRKMVRCRRCDRLNS
jgi:UDP-N-acetylmuramoyl-tripeptide--D-alanyl-D-alanine ligase